MGYACVYSCKALRLWKEWLTKAMVWERRLSIVSVWPVKTRRLRASQSFQAVIINPTFQVAWRPFSSKAFESHVWISERNRSWHRSRGNILRHTEEARGQSLKMWFKSSTLPEQAWQSVMVVIFLRPRSALVRSLPLRRSRRCCRRARRNGVSAIHCSLVLVLVRSSMSLSLSSFKLSESRASWRRGAIRGNVW